MSYIILCDIDGVLANPQHRLHYAREKNYEAFYQSDNLLKDEPFYMGINMLKTLQQIADKTILVTGRNKACYSATVAWLDKYGIKYHDIKMRHNGDYRPSATVKAEIVREILKENEQIDHSYYFIDDDPSNVKRIENISPMYILGITVGTGLYYKLETPISADERSALMHVRKLITGAVEPLDRVLGKGSDGKISGIHD